MKIQIITNLFPVPWNPTRAVFNYQQFKYLAVQYRLKILVLVPWLEYIKNKDLRNEPVPSIDAPVEYASYFYIPKFGRIFYSLFLFPTLLVRYYRIKKEKPDCLLLSWAYPDAVAGIVLSRMLRIPAIIKAHGSDINMHASFRFRARQISWAMKKSSAVLSVSKDLAGKIADLGVPKEKIRVIYNGVDQKRFYPSDRKQARQCLGLDHDRNVILYVGNLKRAKGCIDLINAYKTVSLQGIDVDLYYIGTGEVKAEIEALILKNGLRDRVHVIGQVEHEKLPEWINASNAIVLPSHNEGVPNILLEAMACGIPVVATKVGGIPEIVPDNAGILVELGNNAELAASMTRVLEVCWDRSKIVNGVSKFTWDKNIAELEKVLLSVT